MDGVCEKRNCVVVDTGVVGIGNDVLDADDRVRGTHVVCMRKSVEIDVVREDRDTL